MKKPAVNFYSILSYFYSCAFIGWIFETTVVYLRTNHMTERGLFFINHNPGYYFPFINSIPVLGNLPILWGLPIIEIYGIGGLIIVFAFGRLKKHPVVLFAIGMVSMTVFELLASYFCEIVLRHVYWNYATEFLNFEGRICLRSSIAWGALTVFAILVLKKWLERVYKKEKHVAHYRTIMTILAVYTVACMVLKYFWNKG